jgi:DNA repair protein RadA/Sms
MKNKKSKTIFVCQECGAKKYKYEGRCTECGAWNSLVEEKEEPADKGRDGRGWTIAPSSESGGVKTATLSQKISTQSFRIPTGIGELDRVLGGGLVQGGFTLLGGDPGIGKSTLLLQMAAKLGDQGTKVLYVSAEESVEQTLNRAHRLGLGNDNVHVASENNLLDIFTLVEKVKPAVTIVDSIQTIYHPEITSAPGTVSQVRDCAGHLMALAKSQNISILLIGHITKDGNLAGPKVLEHMVDCVLSFEGDTNYNFRLLRSIKNRFGAANELGVFTMHNEGLEEVSNPSEMFLEERGQNLIGSTIFASVEGSRPLLCEIQALCSPTPMAMPRRNSIGVDVNRLHMLLAVLIKHLNLKLYENDIFINVVGGLKITEPSVDLAVAASLISSDQNKPIDAKTCFMGEIGLTGEVRAVSFPEMRMKEAIKLGFTKFYAPKSNQKNLKAYAEDKSIKITWVERVADLRALT